MGSTASYIAWLEIHHVDGNGSGILNVSNDIYYESEDNEDDAEEGSVNDDTSEFIITQEFIDSLKPGDKMVLSGTGTCY